MCSNHPWLSYKSPHHVWLTTTTILLCSWFWEARIQWEHRGAALTAEEDCGSLTRAVRLWHSFWFSFRFLSFRWLLRWSMAVRLLLWPAMDIEKQRSGESTTCQSSWRPDPKMIEHHFHHMTSEWGRKELMAVILPHGACRWGND